MLQCAPSLECLRAIGEAIACPKMCIISVVACTSLVLATVTHLHAQRKGEEITVAENRLKAKANEQHRMSVSHAQSLKKSQGWRSNLFAPNVCPLHDCCMTHDLEVVQM